ncbi:MAG: hypothetical protein V1729_02190 [Candidatus Woesearchaeota archaeon]
MTDRMMLGKKGIFFTLIAVSLLSIILFSYSVMYSYSLQDKAAVIETRVETMNSFMRAIDEDMENAIYISGYRSIVGLTDYVVTYGDYVNDSTTALSELFLNGTINGTTSSFMVNNTMLYWADRIKDKGIEVGINLSIAIGSVSIYQKDPWEVSFDVDAEINMTDQKATANWSKQASLSYDIPILGFEDPWYAVNTNGLILKRINESIYDLNFSQGNETGNFLDHVANTYYIAFNASPDFLSRFENDFTPSTYGIESIVNKSEILNFCTLSTSSVDNICWKQDIGIETFSIRNMSGTDVRIDNETNDAGQNRIARYGLQDVVY